MFLEQGNSYQGDLAREHERQWVSSRAVPIPKYDQIRTIIVIGRPEVRLLLRNTRGSLPSFPETTLIGKSLLRRSLLLLLEQHIHTKA